MVSGYEAAILPDTGLDENRVLTRFVFCQDIFTLNKYLLVRR